MTADGSWMLWTAIGIGGIWAAVVLISLLSPDMVSGSEQEHQKVAAFTSWFWGGVGTLVFLWAMGRLHGDATWRPTWIGLSIVTFGVWPLATISAIGRWLPRCSPRSQARSRACSAAALVPAEGAATRARVNVSERCIPCLLCPSPLDPPIVLHVDDIRSTPAGSRYRRNVDGRSVIRA